jgi:hypothetical protein
MCKTHLKRIEKDKELIRHFYRRGDVWMIRSLILADWLKCLGEDPSEIMEENDKSRLYSMLTDIQARQKIK